MALTGTEDIYNLALGKIGEYEVTDGATSTKQYGLCSRFYAKARDETLASHPWNEAKVRIVLVQDTDKPIFGHNLKFALPSDCLRVLTVNDSTGADVSNSQDNVYSWEVAGSYIESDAGETPQTWATSTEYYDGEMFTDGTYTYEVLTTHTSDTIANDLTSTYISKTTLNGNTVTAGDYKVIYMEYIYQLTDTSVFTALLEDAIATKLASKIIVGLTNDMKGKVDLINEYERLVMPKARGVDARQGKARPIFNSEWIRSRQGAGGGWYVV